MLQTCFDIFLCIGITLPILSTEGKVPVEKDDGNEKKAKSEESLAIQVNQSASNNRFISQAIPQQSIRTSNNNSQSVPEPSEIIGNLLALMLVVLFFTRKRWNHLLKALLQNKFGKKSN